MEPLKYGHANHQPFGCAEEKEEPDLFTRVKIIGGSENFYWIFATKYSLYILFTERSSVQNKTGSNLLLQASPGSRGLRSLTRGLDAYNYVSLCICSVDSITNSPSETSPLLS